MVTEPLIKLNLSPQHEVFEFLVDSGAKKSAVQKLPSGCVESKDKLQVIGAKGEPFKVPLIRNVTIETPNKYRVGTFLLVPETGYNLLGRELMVELGINLEVDQEKLKIRLCY